MVRFRYFPLDPGIYGHRDKIVYLGQLFGVTLMATAGALSTYQYKLDQQEQYEQYLKDKEIRERRERGEEL